MMLDDDLNKSPIWLTRKPHRTNLRIHPGLRHQSRLFTQPEPYRKFDDKFPEAQLRLVHNKVDAHPQLLIFLNDTKNLFSRQLPNMGEGYISRLVFDLEAETFFILHEGRVGGGITARLFPVEQFIEIAFLAVDTEIQCRGYGRLVMSYLKKSIQVYPYMDILTCADNEAVVYFNKQGFDNEILMDPSRYLQRIKDYEGVTLVHCKVNPDIDYMNFHLTISRQIKFLEDIIGKHVISPPEQLSNAFVAFDCGPTFVNVPLPTIWKLTQTKLDQSNPSETEEEYYEKMGTLKEKLLKIIDKLIEDPDIKEIFYMPVTEDIAKGYFEIIKKPMDLKTMQCRLLKFPDYYKRPEMFAADIRLITENCKLFNKDNSHYIQAANHIYSKFKHLYHDAFPQLNHL